jgi:CHAT domain-containing protein
VIVRNDGAGPVAVLPAADVDISLSCSRCAAVTRLQFPLLLDWRDRRRVELLRSMYPTVACPSCGMRLPVGAPVALLRPGDPIQVLIAVARDVPLATTADADQLADALGQALQRFAVDNAGMIGLAATTDPDLLVAVADRYSGLQLMRLDEPEVGWTAGERMGGWLAAMRTQHEWPDLRAELRGFLSARTDDEARAAYHRAAGLRDSAWQPAIRLLGAAVLASQETAEQLAVASARLGRLDRLGWGRAGEQADEDEPHRAFGLLEQLLSIQSSPQRSSDDIAAGIELGRECIAAATAQWGPDAVVTLTAMNDTAALMLDDPAADVMTERARELLTRAQASCSRQRIALLADVTTNLAIAFLRNNRIEDADATDEAEALLEDSLHLHQLYHPDSPEPALTAISNLATVRRSRLAGDPRLNTRAALELFERALDIDGRRKRLTQTDRITLRTNHLNALASLMALESGGGHLARLLAAIDDVDKQIAELAPAHPLRTRTLTNLGSIAANLLEGDEHIPGDRPAPDDLAARAQAWLTDAVEHTRQLAPDDAGRVLAQMTLATFHAQRATTSDDVIAERLLAECMSALAGTPATRLHHTVVGNLGRLHLARGDWAAAARVFDTACLHADAVIRRARTPATRLAHVAAAGDLYQRLALCHAHQEDARSAIHAVESSRARWGSAGPDDPGDRALDVAISQLLTERTALLYLGTCEIGSYGVLLVAGQGAGVWIAAVGTPALAPVLARLQAPRDIDDVAAALDAAAELLADLLGNAARVVKALGCTTVMIVASGPLAGLPLGALPGPEGALADVATVRYLVSARAAARPARQPVANASVVALVNPTGDLRFADGEIEAVRRFAPGTVTPPAGAGLRGWLLDQLPLASHLHLASHARYEPSDPFASRFILGAELSLTIADLAAVATPELELAVASCCQSGVVDQRGADELVGLAYALIAAGAAAAVAALWEIDDAGTSLLIARFYDELARGAPPAEAMGKAQQAIRTATIEQLVELAGTDSWVPAALRPELRALALHPAYHRAGSRPFAHPAHWAALVYIGR